MSENTTKYEVLYIIRPDMEEASKKALVEQFDQILTSNGVTINESKDWAKRRLAYEINDFREGIYHLITLTDEDSEAIDEFARLAKINNDILRHMIVKLPN